LESQPQPEFDPARRVPLRHRMPDHARTNTRKQDGVAHPERAFDLSSVLRFAILNRVKSREISQQRRLDGNVVSFLSFDRRVVSAWRIISMVRPSVNGKPD
jgi:hypothetical protein